jgi:hypothetical protein
MIGYFTYYTTTVLHKRKERKKYMIQSLKIIKDKYDWIVHITKWYKQMENKPYNAEGPSEIFSVPLLFFST